MTGRAYREIVIGLRNAQTLEEGLRHFGIVVLAGMDDDVRRAAAAQLVGERSKLHEIGSGADYREYAHGASCNIVWRALRVVSIAPYTPFRDGRF